MDALARRGVHSALLHGRDHRPAVRRVRASVAIAILIFGRRVAHPDADALQALARERRGVAARLRGATPRLRAHPRRPTWHRSVGRWSHWRAMLAVSGLMLALTGGLFRTGAEGIHPGRGHGARDRLTRRARGTTFERLNALQQQVAETVQRNPAVAAVLSNAGRASTRPADNVGVLFMGSSPARASARRRGAPAAARGCRLHLRPAVFVENPSAVNSARPGGTRNTSFVLQSSAMRTRCTPWRRNSSGAWPSLRGCVM